MDFEAALSIAERALPSLEAGGARAVEIRDSVAAQLQHAKLALAVLDRFDKATDLLHGSQSTAKRIRNDAYDLLGIARRLAHVERRMCGLRALCSADVKAQDAFAAAVAPLASRVRDAADRELKALEAVASKIEAKGLGDAYGYGLRKSGARAFKFLLKLHGELQLILEVEAIEDMYKKKWLVFGEDKKAKMQKFKDAFLRYCALSATTLVSSFLNKATGSIEDLGIEEQSVFHGKSEEEIEEKVTTAIRDVRSRALEEIRRMRSDLAARIDAGESFTRVVEGERKKKEELEEQNQQAVAQMRSEQEKMVKDAHVQATIPELHGAVHALWQRVRLEPFAQPDQEFPTLLEKVREALDAPEREERNALKRQREQEKAEKDNRRHLFGAAAGALSSIVFGGSSTVRSAVSAVVRIGSSAGYYLSIAGAVVGLGFAAKFAHETHSASKEADAYIDPSKPIGVQIAECFFRALFRPVGLFLGAMSTGVAVLFACGCAGLAVFFHLVGSSAPETSPAVKALSFGFMFACGFAIPQTFMAPSPDPDTNAVPESTIAKRAIAEKRISILEQKAEAMKSSAEADSREDAVCSADFAPEALAESSADVGDLFPASSFDAELHTQYTELLRRLGVRV
eukprot:tig00000788_g4088.t1